MKIDVLKVLQMITEACEKQGEFPTMNEFMTATGNTEEEIDHIISFLVNEGEIKIKGDMVYLGY